jgi:hypothetical protein
VDSCDNIASLELLVDCALYVSLIDADVSKLEVIEFTRILVSKTALMLRLQLVVCLAFSRRSLLPTSCVKISSENFNSDFKANRKQRNHPCTQK